jgi:hypothetical protein
VNGHLTENRVVLFQFKPFRRILTVLLGYVPTGAGLTRGLVLGALEDDLVTVAFTLLCHNVDELELNAGINSLCFEFLYVSEDSKLVDGTHRAGGYPQRDELTRLGNKEFLFMNYVNKTTLSLTFGLRYVIAAYGILAREIANFRHSYWRWPGGYQ